MTDQIPLFVESYDEAITAAVMGMGGFKVVGAMMRPELPADQAGRWLADCVNPARRECLHPDQLGLLRRLARQKGVHVLMAFEAREAGYAEPAALDPETERAKLQREYIQATRVFQSLAVRMERAGLGVTP